MVSVPDNTHWAITGPGNDGHLLRLMPVKETHSEPTGDSSHAVDTIASTPDEVISLAVPVPARLRDEPGYKHYLDGLLAAAGYERIRPWGCERPHCWCAPATKFSPVTPTEYDQHVAAEYRRYGYDRHYGGKELHQRFPRLAALDAARMGLLREDPNMTEDPLAPFPEEPPPGWQELLNSYEELVRAVADGRPI